MQMYETDAPNVNLKNILILVRQAAATRHGFVK